MYGWIVDGISSLLESVSRRSTAEWPGKGNISGDLPCLEAQRQKKISRAAKRSYHSVYVTDGVCPSDPIEKKRRRRDVVISFVKKAVAGVAGLLRLRKPPTVSWETAPQNETQAVSLMGIDELHNSWLKSTEWRMDKPVIGVSEVGGKNPFQGNVPAVVRKYSTPLPERRGSLQLLPSRPTIRVGAANPEPACFGPSRCYKSNLTVEEAIKQNNKEHYRRLLEMVTERYNKSQPLPFNQAKPQDSSLSQVDQKMVASGKTFKLAPRMPSAAPTVFTWRNASTSKDRRSGLTFSKSLSESFEATEPVRCTKLKQTTDLDLSTEVATRLNLVDREPPVVGPSDTQSVHTRLTDEDIPRLNKEMAAEVSGALAQSDPNLVLSAAFKLRITQRDLATLQEGCWLNDEVMNFYLSLVMDRCSGEPGRLKVYTFSTFFFPKLCGGGGQTGGHSAVKRWTKAVDLFLFDLILVPLHLGVHWALAVIDLRTKSVKSYDSMGQRHHDICSLLLHYLKEEHKVKKGRELESTKWTVRSYKASEIPQQKNGSDCGVFACKYADYIAKGRSLTFKQCHMPLFRKLMMWEILNQKLL
ncbi:sentrin-specific protease 2 isoform X3 [Gouania willdenowi]|uniref:sentrin-specific protease 2 isoform X3 n=1 Tax=Gouania willdenowi TaxID=441366 RepID=UPI00105598B3|nr:sentrin-specific protease 2-like isoform X3 [Gouania willdenowi]